MSFRKLTVQRIIEAARRHKDSSEDFIQKAYNLMQKYPHEITTGVSELGKIIKKRANAVEFEIYKLGCYVRLEPYPEMVLVGDIEPEHRTGDLVAEWLAKRFKQFIMVIFTEDDYYVATKRDEVKTIPNYEGNKKEIVTQIRNLASRAYDSRLDEDFIQLNGDELWKEYYKTQYLSQRLNLKAYHRDIPKYMFNKAKMNIEKEFFDQVTDTTRKNKTLDDFYQ